MFFQIASARITGLARAVSFIKARNRRAPLGLALVCLLLAGCVTSGDGPSPTASGQNASLRSDSVAAPADAAKPATAPAIAVSADPVVLQRRRQIIAAMLEAQPALRTFLTLKLTNAKLAGPLESSYKALFTGRILSETMYCASVELEHPLSLIPDVKTAVIRVKPLDNGQERIEVSGGNPFECNDPKYGPFPEIVELRTKRRAALGKTD